MEFESACVFLNVKLRCLFILFNCFHYVVFFYSCSTQETSKWVEVALQSIQTQIVPGSFIATPQQLYEFHNALIG